MHNSDIEKMLRRAAADAAPDVLDRILSRCNEEEGRVIDMAENKENRNASTRKRVWAYVGGLAAVLVLALTGAGYYLQFRTVDSIVGFDVNPSLELEVSRQEKILDVTTLNEDAKAILDNMDLRGSNLNVAVNALIGSMLKNGYINELKNSILITVESNDTRKSTELQQRIVEEIDAILNANSITGSILSQSLENDSTYRTIAGDYDISIGKASLIDEIVTQNPLLTYDELAPLSIYELNLIAETKDIDLHHINTTGAASDKAYIGEDSAKAAALSHAGLDASAVTFHKFKLDWDDGVVEYEMEFETVDAWYEYDIDALTGTILSSDIDYKKKAPSNVAPVEPSASSGNAEVSYIGEETAKSTALEHAGLTAADVTFHKVKLDKDDRKVVYEVEFFSGSTEYDYEIDAQTGTILSYDQEIEGYDLTAPITPGGTGTAELIGEEAAKSIAQEKAPGAVFVEFELDYDDGRAVYEGEMRNGNIEYEFEIDAASGAVLKWEEDLDD